MRGLVLQGGRARVRDDLPEPRPLPGEVTVAVRLAGICATDLALARGYMDFSGVPGHEFVGVALDGRLAGRRVVGDINVAPPGEGAAHDGTVDESPCAGPHDARHAPGRTVLGILGRDGCFAERLTLPSANLHAVPDAVPDEQAVFAEPLAAALQMLDQVEVAPGTRALVAGDGRLGLLCAHVLHRAGARVRVAGRHPEHAALLPDDVELVTGLLEHDAAPAQSERVDLAVEATGHPDVLPRLLPFVRPRGRVILKTTGERPVTLALARVVVDELQLIGSRCGRLERALEVLAEGRLPLERFVRARFGLERAAEALAAAARPGALKVLIEVGAG